MKIFNRRRLLVLSALLAAALISCQPTVRELPPIPPPVEAPEPVQTPTKEPEPVQLQVEEPEPETPPAEEPPPAEPTVDLSYLVASDPAEVDNSDLPITPVEQLGITGTAPEINIEDYHLSVKGIVENKLSLAYEDILSYPTVTETVLLICPYFFADNAEWSGVPVMTILDEAGITQEPSEVEVTFYATDGYFQTISLEDVQQAGMFLAHTVNGQTLPPEHGYPVRLVAQGKFGAVWVKWVESIEVTYR